MKLVLNCQGKNTGETAKAQKSQSGGMENGQFVGQMIILPKRFAEFKSVEDKFYNK